MGRGDDKTSRPEIWLSPKNMFPLKNVRECAPGSMNGRNELEPVQVIKWDNNFFIYDGHERCRVALETGMSLVPVTIVNAVNGNLPNGQSTRGYLGINYVLKNVSDWEAMHNFRFVSYFTPEN